MGRFLQLSGLAIGIVGLLLQTAITIPASMEAGRGFFGSIVYLLTFFTILTNIAAVLVHLSLISTRGYAWLPFFAGARVRAGVAISITLVFIIYTTVLRGLVQLEGLFLLCDILLHYVTPVLFVLWWLVAGADGSTRWRDIPVWMTYPVACLAVALARAPFAGEVPYPFLDFATKGWGAVLLNSLMMTTLFLVLSVLAILADHVVSRSRKRPRLS